MFKDWDTELPEKQSVSDTFSQVRQSDTTAGGARTMRSGPPRGGSRRRPVSDGQSYRNGGTGSGRLRAAEPRVARSSPYNVGNRQRLSSSEDLPMEV